MGASANLLIHQAVLYGFAGLLAWAALSDLRDYVIPNRLCLGIAGLYPAYVLSSPAPVDWVAAMMIAAAVFVAGLVLYALHMTGGGDVKLLAAASLWAGPDMILAFLLVTAIAGGLISVAMMPRLWATRVRGAGAARLAFLRARVPYGIAITVSGMYVVGKLLAATTA